MHPFQRRGPGRRAVASQDRGAVAGIRCRAGAGGRKCNLIGLTAIPRLSGEKGARFLIVNGLYVRLLILAIRPQHPLGEIERRDLSAAGGVVTQPQAVHLYRITGSIVVQWNKYRELLPDGVAIVLEHRVALAVAGPIGVILANGLRRGAPARAAVVVAQV